MDDSLVLAKRGGELPGDGFARFNQFPINNSNLENQFIMVLSVDMPMQFQCATAYQAGWGFVWGEILFKFC